MVGPEDEPFLDDDAGRLVRPYTVSNGRTRPSTHMELLSWVMATGRLPRGHLEPDHARALRLCGGPTTVAEISAHLKLPAAITKVVLSDLVDCGALSTRAPSPIADPADRSVLEAVLYGLQQRL
ncbi:MULTISPECIES: DUF742 domain-containing protein [Micromonospora]|uniref:DUF742 domain-containing protein n=1 Tax=Micromonospora sicca TaxID=2202420 RepID=A0A317DR93_9ACTN|nr:MULTISPECIES: DUF742 domain-containing protein [unclassified Micromonospora]MBM0225073.1 DUF742 domain-containing protein [Micromonospora sp. ATA51]MDZ5447086.1 DUF742 domain-containing protein [Micromonospora sp. 4G57]MDZ5494554.1 DUF742 domain-containing protein [Micromonospora sp. 4G53]PWR15415.1 DUF742 domain-containing protein [Micromonospora sp. 4G51]